MMLPLELKLPAPLTTSTDPPVLASVVVPAIMVRRPPSPEVPWPTTTLMEPARPNSERPDATVMSPVFPLLAVPEDSNNTPEVPSDTALADRIVTVPLDEDTPLPLTMTTLPPTLVVSTVRPASMRMSPPVPEYDVSTRTSIRPATPLWALPDKIAMEPVFPDRVVPC